MSKKDKQIEELLKMYRMWLDNDIVKAGTNFVYIEKRNEAFARGWRFAILGIIGKLEDLRN